MPLNDIARRPNLLRLIRCRAIQCCALIAALSGCASPPPPCNCVDVVEKLASNYADYHQCLSDRGLLRQRLKALEEKP